MREVVSTRWLACSCKFLLWLIIFKMYQQLKITDIYTKYSEWIPLQKPPQKYLQGWLWFMQFFCQSSQIAEHWEPKMKGNGFNSLKNVYSCTTLLMYLHGSNWKLLVDLYLKLEAADLSFCHSHSAVSVVNFAVHLLIKLLILHHLYN